MKKHSKTTQSPKEPPIGLISSSWDVVPMREIAEFSNGLNFLSSDNGENYRIIGVSGFQNYFYPQPDSFERVEVSEKLPSRAFLNENDLLFVRSNGNKALIGRCLFIRNLSEPTAFSGFTIRARILSNRILPMFCAIFFRSAAAKAQIQLLGGGTNISNLSQKILGSILIPVPPLPVQERIINAFSSWESSIEIANATVAAKKKFKAAVMHQLLSGRIRFPGFGSPIKKAGLLPEGWVETSLEEISSITFSGVDKKCREGQRPIRLCNYLDVYKNDYITQNLSFMEATASEAEIAKLELKSGDVIITKDSETPDDIGIPGVVIEDLPGVVCGYHLALIRPDMTKVEPIFLATQFHSHSAKKQFNAVANGAIRFGLSTTAIRGFRFFLPPLPEQRRIAHLVRSFDREITLLNRTVKLLQTQKEGMMLKLLTAKIRVKV